MIVTQVCAAIIIEDLKYWMDLLPCRWLKTAVTVAQNLREDGSLSPEYTQRPRNQRRSVIAGCGIAWAVGTIYAKKDEFHQTLVPGRSGEVLDVCIDAAGVLCGVVIMSVLVGRYRKSD